MQTWRSCSCKFIRVLVLLYLRYVCGNSFSMTRLSECDKSFTGHKRILDVFSIDDSRMKLLSFVRHCSATAALFTVLATYCNTISNLTQICSSQANCYTALCFRNCLLAGYCNERDHILHYHGVDHAPWHCWRRKHIGNVHATMYCTSIYMKQCRGVREKTK